jgi:hypothetical protein
MRTENITHIDLQETKTYKVIYWSGQEIIETTGAGNTSKAAKENCKAQHLASSTYNTWPIRSRDIIQIAKNV